MFPHHPVLTAYQSSVNVAVKGLFILPRVTTVPCTTQQSRQKTLLPKIDRYLALFQTPRPVLKYGNAEVRWHEPTQYKARDQINWLIEDVAALREDIETLKRDNVRWHSAYRRRFIYEVHVLCVSCLTRWSQLFLD